MSVSVPVVAPQDGVLSIETRQSVAEQLSRVLASSYAVYQKTHGYHWNVRGPYFAALHQLFSDQYNEIWTALDEIAERVRALGVLAPQTFSAYSNLTSIREGDGTQNWEAMLEELLSDHEVVAEELRLTIRRAADLGDDATADLCTGRLAAHDKHAWMLRASLGR